jgi:hypothetical protein
MQTRAALVQECIEGGSNGRNGRNGKLGNGGFVEDAKRRRDAERRLRPAGLMQQLAKDV